VKGSRSGPTAYAMVDETAKRLFFEGWSLDKIADHLGGGITDLHITHLAARHGWQRRRAGGHSLTIEEVSHIVALREEGLTQQQIADKVGRSRSPVVGALRRHNRAPVFAALNDLDRIVSA
jgi:hypothetical protein